MAYRFKFSQEAVWFVLVAAGTVVLQALATLDVDKVTDWRVWAVGLLAATIRAGAGAALSLLTQPAPSLPPTGRLSPEQLNQVASELERRMRETPARPDAFISRPPNWLPPGPDRA